MKTVLTVCFVVLGLVGQVSAQSYHVVNFQAQSGHYVVAESGGNDVMNVDRGSAGAWETFELYDTNGGDLESFDEIYIRTSNGYYASQTCFGPYVPNVSRQYAYATGHGCWSNAVVYKYDNNNNYVSGLISSGDQVAINMWHGWWQAVNGGGGQLRITNNAIGAWEKFFITIW